MTATWLVSSKDDCTAWDSEQQARAEVKRLAPVQAVLWRWWFLENADEASEGVA